MGPIESALQWAANLVPDLGLQLVIAVGALLFAVVVLRPAVGGIRNSWHSDVDWGTVLIVGIVMGVATGLLWAFVNPVKIVPPYIHLRLFAFLPPLVGLVAGWRTGFISGYVATLVWALLAGAFVPLHTPLVDGIFVGLTGALPVLVLRGDLSTTDFLEKIGKEGWFGQALRVGAATGLFMSVFVAISLQLTTPLPFWLSFWAIGVISDTIPIMLGLALLGPPVVRLTRTMTWLPQPV